MDVYGPHQEILAIVGSPLCHWAGFWGTCRRQAVLWSFVAGRGLLCFAALFSVAVISKKCGRIVQLARAPALHAGSRRFESCFAYHKMPKNRFWLPSSAPMALLGFFLPQLMCYFISTHAVIPQFSTEDKKNWLRRAFHCGNLIKSSDGHVSGKECSTQL